MVLLIQKEGKQMEKAIKVINYYLEEAKESYNTWLMEYDRTESSISEDKLLEYKQQIILLESILRDLRR